MMKDSIEIINLVPRFLNFYNKAVGCDEETRFELWKEHYSFVGAFDGNKRVGYGNATKMPNKFYKELNHT